MMRWKKRRGSVGRLHLILIGEAYAYSVPIGWLTTFTPKEGAKEEKQLSFRAIAIIKHN